MAEDVPEVRDEEEEEIGGDAAQGQPDEKLSLLSSARILQETEGGAAGSCSADAGEEVEDLGTTSDCPMLKSSHEMEEEVEAGADIHSPKEEEEKEMEWTCQIVETVSLASDDSHRFQEDLKKEFLTNRCQFTCDLCNTIFDSSLQFWSHVKTDHDTDPLKYMASHKKFCSVKVKYRCKICRKKILHDIGYIERHLEKEHQLAVVDYIWHHEWRSTTVREEAPLVEAAVSANEEGNGAVGKKDSVAAGGDEMLTPEGQEENEVNRITLKLWDDGSDISDAESLKFLEHPALTSAYNKCVFECSPCQDQFFSKCAVLLHFRSVHNLSRDEYLQKYGSFRILDNYQTCYLCDNEILLDGLVFQCHLVNQHRVNLWQYYQILNSDKSFLQCSLFKCMLCSSHVGSCQKSFSAHLAEAHDDMTLSEYKESHGSIFYARLPLSCVICKKSFSSGKTMGRHLASSHNISFREYRFLHWNILKHPEAVVVSEDVDVLPFFNGCIFRCQVCHTPHVGSAQLRRHVEGEHFMSHSDYSGRYDTVLLSDKTYRCLICQKELRHDYPDIVQHLTNVHKLSLAAYFQSHKKKILQEMKNQKREKIRMNPRKGPCPGEVEKESHDPLPSFPPELPQRPGIKLTLKRNPPFVDENGLLPDKPEVVVAQSCVDMEMSAPITEQAANIF